MSFVLEESKIGRDTVLFNNYKYRECYSVKSGDIVWRCLGKSCKASIRTNSGKTAIFTANETHTGPHPVTMRTMSPLSSKNQTPKSGVSSPFNSDMTPALQQSANTTLLEQKPMRRRPMSHTTPPCLATPPVSQLILRNKTYDASTQTDDDCLKSTDTLLSRIHELTDRQSLLIDHIQDLKKQLEEANKLIENSKNPCNRCAILEEETKNMIASIRILEEDNIRNRAKLNNNKPYSMLSHKESSILDGKAHCFPLPLSNSFSPLGEVNDSPLSDVNYNTYVEHNNKQIPKQQRHRRTRKNAAKANVYKNKSKENSRKTYENKVYLYGCSHARGLGEELKSIMPSTVETCGSVNPGAPIEPIVHSLAAGSERFTRNDCCVLIGGTNNFNIREKTQEDNSSKILKSIKTVMEQCSNTNIAVCPLLHRYDLHKDSDINRSIIETNRNIRQLVNMFPNGTIIDTSFLTRQDFTKHGLHLNRHGKRKLSSSIRSSVLSIIRCPPTPIHTGLQTASTILNIVDDSPSDGNLLIESPRAALSSTSVPANELRLPQHGCNSLPTSPHRSCSVDQTPVSQHKSLHNSPSFLDSRSWPTLQK